MKYIMRLTKNKTFRKEQNMKLKNLRIKAKLTQEQTSKLTGLSIRYISLLENGRRNPSDNSKRKLAKAYGVEPVAIFLACQGTKCSKK